MYSFLNRSLYRYLRVSTEIPRQCKQKFHEKAITFDDTLDEFTSQLTQKKANKWNIQKDPKKPMNDCLSNTEINNTLSELKDYSIEKINLLFKDCIELGNNLDLVNLTRQCIEYRKCPSLSNLTHILTLCAQEGDKNLIILLDELCEEFHPDIAKANSNFRHYLAEAIWVKGNILESLKMFKEVYSENAFLRRRIRLVFKFLTQDIISTRSEAALINIVKFAEELLREYKDFFPLACVWQSCFLSEWFTDQCLALQLLEMNEGLCKAVVNRVPYVVTISLSSHRTDVVYRLLELLLKYEMKLQYSSVLSALLDYQISRGDLRSSSEIIQWSINNNVQLPAYQNKRFLDLFLHKNKESSKLLELVNTIKSDKVKRDLKF
ncbi:uncharacterized protein LOC108904839 [Anoplophora glabripennis]|uniref:uncharacterized protein LOC108904839 n=1 Tax=Anoplophora glabripennis TaxID=217634 RepID=UPI0008749BE8|nr:uncharacterized protein LOC108904839 [Anoplophora glabripennis]